MACQPFGHLPFTPSVALEGSCCGYYLPGGRLRRGDSLAQEFPLFYAGLVVVFGHAGSGDRHRASRGAGDGGPLYLYTFDWLFHNDLLGRF